MKALEQTVPDSSDLFYLYCIMERGVAAQRLLEEYRVPGLEPNEPLFPIEGAGLVAAVSLVPGNSFQEEPLNALLRELSRLAPLALRHDEAIRTLLPLAPALIPMSLGTVYRSPERVVQLLQERAAVFRDLLSRLRGKQEWGVKVFSDTVRLRQAAEDHSEQLRGLAEEAAHSGPGKAYLVRKQREGLLAIEAERFVRQCLDTILKGLGMVSVAVQVDQLPVPHPNSLPLVLKVSLLVEVSMVGTLRTVVGELQQSYTPLGLRLELNGPWAPYSFVGELGSTGSP